MTGMKYVLPAMLTMQLSKKFHFEMSNISNYTPEERSHANRHIDNLRPGIRYPRYFWLTLDHDAREIDYPYPPFMYLQLN